MRIGLSLVGQTSQVIPDFVAQPNEPVIDLIKSLGGTVVYINSNGNNCFTDSGNTLTSINTSVGRITDSYSNVAFQDVPESKPTRKINSKNSNVIYFDGVNDFLSTSILTGNQGWICSGVTYDNTSSKTIASSGAGIPTEKGAIALLYNMSSTEARFFAQISNGTERIQSNIIIPINEYCVVSMGWDSISVVAGVNHAQANPATISGDFIGIGGITIGKPIGAFNSMFSGEMTAFVYLPSIPSAENKTTIINWVSSL